MSHTDWSNQVPSRREAEQRAVDDRAARRERILDWAAGIVIALIVIGLAAAVGYLSGDLR